jgi:hypothetical protein
MRRERVNKLRRRREYERVLAGLCAREEYLPIERRLGNFALFSRECEDVRRERRKVK